MNKDQRKALKQLLPLLHVIAEHERQYGSMSEYDLDMLQELGIELRQWAFKNSMRAISQHIEDLLNE